MADRAPLTERSRCGIHGCPTSTGRCEECVADRVAELREDGPVIVGEDFRFLLAEHDHLRAALDEIDRLDPTEFLTGQSHLPPAFREPDLRAAFRRVVQIVNRTLHGTDENGHPLPPKEPDAPDAE